MERLDGAIKRAWLRYRHKLKGLPLEYVRMATVDEMEATRVTKEALQDLAKQLSSGRVNADILEDDIPEQPPEYQPDGRYPQMEFSDEEDSPEAPVGPDELRKATSVLDDVPMSVAQGVQSGRHSAPDRSTRRRVGPAPAEASSIRATVASSSADDPALRTVRQKRDFYEEAFKTTQEHLKKMKKKLEPQSTLIVKPVATSPEMEESEQSGEVEDALVTSESADTNVTSVDSPFIDVDLFALPSVTDDAGLQHEVPSQMFVTDMLLESVPLERPFDVLEARSRTPRGFSQVGIRRHPTPSTRAKVTSTKWRQLGDVPGRLRRPLTQAELVEAYHKGGFDDFHITRGPEGDYWLHSPFQRELWRVHIQPRRRMFVPGAIPDEDHPQDAEPLPAGVRGLHGLRTTQVGYLAPSNTKDYILDNLYWKGWNTALDPGSPMEGCDPFSDFGSDPGSSSPGNVDAGSCVRGGIMETWTECLPGFSWLAGGDS